MDFSVRLPAKSSSIYAVVTRADGRVENLGLISYRHRNPFIHFAVNFYIRLKDFIRGATGSK